MGDRNPSFPFRFWTRRTPTTQTAPPLATTSTPAPPPTTETKAGSASSSTALPPSETENQKPDSSTTTTTPTPITQPITQTQMATQPTNTETTARPIAEPQKSSPSRRDTQSRLPPQPSSPSFSAPVPSRLTTQSKSPPQPSSPSHAAHQTRSITSSPSRMGSQGPWTPQSTSLPLSSPHLVPRSPKQEFLTSTKDNQPTSPSKKSKGSTQEISKSNGSPTFLPNEEGPKLASSQKEPIEPQPKEEVKSDRTNDGLTANGTSIKHDEMEVVPSKSSELGTTTTSAPAITQELDSSTVNGEREPLSKLNVNPEETKEVKEVVQVTNTEANEETKNAVNGFQTPKSDTEARTTENAEIPSKSDQMDMEKQETFGRKENLAASSPNIKLNNTTSQPRKRDMTLDNDKQSDLPSGEHVPLYKEIREDISTFVNQMAIGDPKSAIYDKQVSVITLAGENRGATMRLGLDSSKKESSIHIHRGYKINPDESSDTTTDGEGSSKEAAKTENAKTLEDQPPEAYVNNNAQSINNSLVFNCSITERNPGVHMVFTHVPKEPIESTDKTRPLETRKSEFNTTHPEKLTYEPTIRRRCLKGLFLEPSDSETEKPRRHGCRVGCKEKGKHEEIDALST